MCSSDNLADQNPPAAADPDTAPKAKSKPVGHETLLVAGKPVIFRARVGHGASQTAKESAWKKGLEARNVELDCTSANGVRDVVASVAPGGVVIFEEMDSASESAVSAVADALQDDSRIYVVCTRAPVPQKIKDLCGGGEVVMSGAGSSPLEI